MSKRVVGAWRLAALVTLAAGVGCIGAQRRLAGGALNTADEARAPRPIRCRAVAGTTRWDAADEARLGVIMSDTTAGTRARSAEVRSTWPELATFERLEARACTVLAAGRVRNIDYEVFVDSVIPAVLDAVPVSRADSAFRLLAPRPRSPAHRTVFRVSPRRTVVSWDAVPRAAYYLLEVQALVAVYHRSTNGGDPVFDHAEWTPHGEGLHSATVRGRRALFYFIGAQPGRWRVRAIGPRGVASRPSEWQQFTHTR